ncbi:Zinc finger BED domain-containing protein DAYSLEEPER [Striga hermonthica]|uniref:Zinc finger BED domain-containing protein DAYSLEEPER n=1 Tax=Striga hermonthica TaxID=68872 RepID=A0A9N7NK19_STRHE|nr:Zinc finger BED domain-containing protein DAYSLEEPER [Striga hermonthica]
MSNPTPFNYFLQYPQLHLILEWVSPFFDLHHIRNLPSLHPVLPFVGLSRLTPYTHLILPFGAFILFALSTLEIFVLPSIRVPIEARVPILALTRVLNETGRGEGKEKAIEFEKEVGEDVNMDDVDDFFFLEEENQQRASSKDELERYLEELSEKYRVDFDILAWWKVNSVRYPNLSCVARDVLAIQSSTVASESAFSTGGRTLDRFRSSLTPTTAEVLICCQDWLRNTKTPNGVEEIIEDLEILEMGM